MECRRVIFRSRRFWRFLSKVHFLIMACHQSCPNRQVRLSPQVLDSPENSVAIPKERYRSAKLRVRYFLFARFRPKMANSILGLSILYAIRPFTKRSEEHTSELQSLMRISYAIFCLK